MVEVSREWQCACYRRISPSDTGSSIAVTFGVDGQELSVDLARSMPRKIEIDVIGQLMFVVQVAY
jgi:hypothetical protein